ncbi:MAG TPA: RodZ domain-containing protein [Gaiellaceae bacterium]
MFEIGNSLKEARMRQGLDFPELEQSTKIRAKYLRALEAEQFDVLPAQTYVKGFLRSYAESLGLDGQLYVDEYSSRFVVGEESRPSRPRRAAAPPSRGIQLQSRVLLLTLLGIAAVAALVIVAWTSGDPPKETPVGLGTPPLTQTGASRPAVANLARLHVLAAKGPCWLQVHRGSATGRILYQGTLERGQDQVFTGKRLWITLDRPENLITFLNGRHKSLPLGGPKTLIVTPTAIRSGV